MTKIITGILLLITMQADAQKILLKAESWDYKPDAVEFLTYKNVPAMKVHARSGQVALKNFDFTDGTIEYDMDPVDPYFTSVYFRVSSKEECEIFYFRTGAAGNRYAMDAVQYAPILKNVNLWDMLPQYQNSASFERGKWNHVKLVIAGKQMRAYVNNSLVLQVPYLEGDSRHGTIAFDGQVVIANLVIKPNQTEGLSPLAGVDLTDNDPRYLRKWLVTSPVNTDSIDFKDSFKPDSAATWNVVAAERQGLINLTRNFGESKKRRIVWLKTSIHSDTMQVRKLDFGFSDEVWVFINGRYLYVDKNLYGRPIAKQPDGRCSIENTYFNIPLQKGDNELLIGLSNNFYGWGIVARLDKMEGLRTE
jgi:hypothetical protein